MSTKRKLSTKERLDVKLILDSIREREKENLQLLNDPTKDYNDHIMVEREIKHKLSIADSTWCDLNTGKRILGLKYCLNIIRIYNIDTTSCQPTLLEYYQLKQKNMHNTYKE